MSSASLITHGISFNFPLYMVTAISNSDFNLRSPSNYDEFYYFLFESEQHPCERSNLIIAVFGFSK